MITLKEGLEYLEENNIIEIERVLFLDRYVEIDYLKEDYMPDRLRIINL